MRESEAQIGNSGLLLPLNLRGSSLLETVSTKRRKSMKREIIRVEPLATYLEKYKAPGFNRY